MIYRWRIRIGRHLVDVLLDYPSYWDFSCEKNPANRGTVLPSWRRLPIAVAVEGHIWPTVISVRPSPGEGHRVLRDATSNHWSKVRACHKQ